MNFESRPDLTLPTKEIEPEHNPEQLRILEGELNVVSETADTLERELLETRQAPSETRVRFAGLAGRARDVAYATARKLLIVLVLVNPEAAALVSGAEHHQRSGQGVEQVSPDEQIKSPERKRSPLEFRSSQYSQLLSVLREKLAAEGISHLPDADSAAEYGKYEKYLEIINNKEFGGNELRDAIFKHNQTLPSTFGEFAIREKSEIGSSEWEAVIKEINYPSSLNKAAYEFGVDPYKRLGYQKDKNFNTDVLRVAAELNSRLEILSKKTGKHYPAIDAGMIAATALQEGFAKLINDKEGYQPEARINNYTDVGLDALSEDLPKLEKQGLMPEGFKERLLVSQTVTLAGEIFGREAYKDKNEQQMRAERLEGETKHFLEGLGAMLVEKRNTVIDAIGEKEWGMFSQDEQHWISYAAYQYGPGNVIRLIREGQMTVRVTDKEFKSVPIANYPRYHDGKIVGQVSSAHDFIYRNHGRKYRASRLSDFHHMASQVAVSAKISNSFLSAIHH